MPEQRLHIGLDCDGVLYNFVDALRNWIHIHTGRPLEELPPATVWEFYEADWGYTTTQFLELYAQGVNAGYIFAAGAPYPKTAKTLRKLSRDGHRLTVVTNRMPPGVDVTLAEKLTRNWLAKWNLSHDDVVLSSDKTVAGADVFLEDHVANYADLKAADVNAALFDRPWNQHATEAVRVHTWDDFQTLVDNHGN